MFKVKKQTKEINKKKDAKTSNGKESVAKKSNVPDLICKVNKKN